ncbi:unnamed protein product [Protopolystoma xenopodis]|uniref:Uncharacterized protein n=1 Tax=Protopolystoma xenopodis TaxID=117903 RepID=A0A3S5A3W9_9PLAT|nr:unnamed protein product [Protopolystoma xenopodis]
MQNEIEATKRRVNELEEEIDFKSSELNKLQLELTEVRQALEQAQLNFEKEMAFCDMKRNELSRVKVGKTGSTLSFSNGELAGAEMITIKNKTL